MVLLNDSLAVVLIGDWNKLYIQPEWIALNIFERDEIEIGINREATEFTIAYKADNVMISAEQNKVVFTSANTDKATLDTMTKCINNYLSKASTPVLCDCGLNCDFVEDSAIAFASIIDGLSDTSSIIEEGYEIISTKISRSMAKDGKILNMESGFDNSLLTVHFNEHYSELDEDFSFTEEILQKFLQSCTELMKALGYELEGDE